MDDSQSTDGAENKNGSDNEDDDDDDDDDLYEDPNYILPNSYTDDPSKLTRWSSDNALSKATLRTYLAVLSFTSISFHFAIFLMLGSFYTIQRA